MLATLVPLAAAAAAAAVPWAVVVGLVAAAVPLAAVVGLVEYMPVVVLLVVAVE